MAKTDSTADLPNPLAEEPTPPARRKMDPELQTMAKIDALLCDLSDEGVFRVLTWLTNKYARTDKVMNRYVEMDRAGISEQAWQAYQDQAAAMKGG